MSIYSTVVSIGDSKKSKRVVREALGKERFDNPKKISAEKLKQDGKDNTYYVPAIFNGEQRVTERLERSVLIVIDIDDSTRDNVNASLALIKKDGLEFIIHTTTSHTEAKPRFRMLLKPSRPVSEQEYRILNRVFCDKYSIKADPSSFKPAQLMFFPLVVTGTEELYKHVHHEGRTVNVDELLSGIDIKEKSETDTLPILMPPGGLSNELFISCIGDAFPAQDCEYDDWALMGMALWHQTNGTKAGLITWIKWSRASDKHGIAISEEEMVKDKWPSFNPRGKAGATMRQILNRKKPSGGTVLGTVLSVMISTVETGRELETIAADIKNDPFVRKNDLGIISKAYRAKHNEIESTEISTGEARRLFDEVTVTGEEGQYFFNNYVYDATRDKYIHISSKQEYTIRGFNFMYGHLMPYNNSGTQKVPHSVLSNESNNFKKPHKIVGQIYRPGESDLITKANGVYLNLFDKSSWPQPCSSDDDNDLLVVDAINRHMLLLASGREDVAHLLKQHLGWLRQRPLDRIYFAYSISSQLQGVGKSTLKLLYSTVLGEANVNTVYPTNLSEKFNSFSGAPKLMTFIEEFEFDSFRERNKAIKSMKELITSDIVSVRKMNTDAYMTSATTCYGLFSNDSNVIGVEGAGRRWLPIDVDVFTYDEMSELLGEDYRSFFDSYYRLLELYPDKFCKYFNNIDLAGFDSRRVNIMTKEKQSYEDSSPVNKLASIIKTAILEGDDPDILDGIIFLPSVKRYIEREADMSGDAGMALLVAIKDSSSHAMAKKALAKMQYIPLPSFTNRLTAPGLFDRVDRPYTESIMIHRSMLKNNNNKVFNNRKVRRIVGELREARLDKKPEKIVPISDEIDIEAAMERI